MPATAPVAQPNRGRMSVPAQAASSRSQNKAPGSAGGILMSVLSTSVTKQTRDMRYSEAEPLWFLSFGLTHDDAVCPGKRVVSWISACSSYRVTKRKRCQSRTSAVNSECHGQLDTGGSTATRKSDLRGS